MPGAVSGDGDAPLHLLQSTMLTELVPCSLPGRCLGISVLWPEDTQAWLWAVCPCTELVRGHSQTWGRSSQRTPPCLRARQRLWCWSGAGRACSASPPAQGAQQGQDPPSPWQSRRVLGRRGAILKSTAEPALCPTSARVRATGKQPRAQTQPLAASIFPNSLFPAVPRSCSTTTSHVPLSGLAQPRCPVAPQGPLGPAGMWPSAERKIRFGCHLPSQERKNLSNKTRF